MTELLLARLLFAITASVHYLFVAITLGLTPIIATALTVAAVRQSSEATSIVSPVASSLGRLYVANYGVGIVSGLVMELQMALLWTGAGTDAYAPIASLIALETVVAFFLESTLLGLWLAGVKVMPVWVQAGLFWGITVTAYASAVFIVAANAYLHAPLSIGPLTSEAFMALLLRPAAMWPLGHIAASSLVVGAFWCCTVAGAALRVGNDSLGRQLIRIGVFVTAFVSAPLAISGFGQFNEVRDVMQVDTPFVVHMLIGVMIISGLLIGLLSWFVMVPLTLNGKLFASERMLRLLQIGTAIPMVVVVLGWISRELARQPWFIVGSVSIQDAASPVGARLLIGGAVVFVVLSLTTLGVAWIVFKKVIRKGAYDGLAQLRTPIE